MMMMMMHIYMMHIIHQNFQFLESALEVTRPCFVFFVM